MNSGARGGLFALLCLVAQSCPALCDPMDCSPSGSSAHGDSPGKNTGLDCHALLQGFFPTQEPNQDLLHCRQILYQQSYQGSPGDSLDYTNVAGVTYDTFYGAYYPRACT